jgi:hypothetical protein
LRNKDYLRAERSITEAFSQWNNLEITFNDVEKRQKRKDFRSLYDLGKENRNLQYRGIEIKKNMRELGEQGKINEYNKLKEELNMIIKQYNKNRSAMESIIVELEKEIRKR